MGKSSLWTTRPMRRKPPWAPFSAPVPPTSPLMKCSPERGRVYSVPVAETSSRHHGPPCGGLGPHASQQGMVRTTDVVPIGTRLDDSLDLDLEGASPLEVKLCTWRDHGYDFDVPFTTILQGKAEPVHIRRNATRKDFTFTTPGSESAHP